MGHEMASNYGVYNPRYNLNNYPFEAWINFDEILKPTCLVK